MRHLLAAAIAAAWIPVLAFEPSVGMYTVMLMAAVCALAAGAIAAPPWTSACASTAALFGPLVFAEDIAENEPGFPAMLVPLGMVAVVAVAAAFAGNLITREYRKGR